jgi:hypothetical protein
MAYITFWVWLRQTRKMVSCAARAEITRIRRITPLQGPFAAIFLLMVSYPITFVGLVTEEKEVIMKDNVEERVLSLGTWFHILEERV